MFFSLLAFASTSSAADLRGFVSEGAAGVLQYQFCKGDTLSRELYPIEDKTTNAALRDGVAAVRQMMLHRFRPLYVEVRGERGKDNATASQFQRALGTVESCKSLPQQIPSNARLIAAGEAPAWRFTSAGSSAVLELPEKHSMKLSMAALDKAGKSQTRKDSSPRTYELQSADGKTVQIEINPVMCTDGRSETAFGARVTVRIDKRVLQGCAARF